MSQEFGDDFITLTDEDGTEYELEVLARVEFEGSDYVALVPADAADDDSDLEVSILKVEEEDGDEVLVAVEDEDELERVYNYLMELIYEEDEEDAAPEA